MTEPEWLAATHPEPMLLLVGRTASPRTLRLFGVACCWDRGHWLWEGPASAAAVAVAER